MSVTCPFCGVEGDVVENENAAIQNSNGSTKPMFGVRFDEHKGSCPFRFVNNYRCNYISRQEAIEAYKCKYL